jgi:uncharacterized protein YyaL (SSP411 family)
VNRRSVHALVLALMLVMPMGASAAKPAATLPGAEAFGAALLERLAAALAERGADYVPRTRHRNADGSPRFANRLLLESSPYLLQHAHNPVDWYPWGDEAFARAKALKRPVLVSIGYSTCHWCHVMEEESFEDLEIAKLLNERFVAIKVDRETRPEIDSVYMAALQAMGQDGGWPLNVFVTPAGDPFFGGTYFPPRDQAQRPGFLSRLERIHTQYRRDPSGVDGQAASLSRALADRLGSAGAAVFELDAAPIESAIGAYASGYDAEWGGVGGRIKFPSSLSARLLLRWHRRTGDIKALEMATHSLDRMAAGGIRDHLGGGFHRYSTDRRWLVPHFEKMLYDQALLAVTYLEGWQVTRRADFREVVREILDYVLAEMTSPEGGFHSASDADSAGPDGEMEEGRFFTWTPAELETALGSADAALARAWWGVSATGDVEGRAVLRRWRSPLAVASELSLSQAELQRRIPGIRARLLAARAKRSPPLRDEKVLAAWNGLMISAFARAGLAFNEARYTQAAEKAADFVLGRMRSEGRLHRVALAGRASGPGYLDDYAFVVAGLLDLYEAAPNPRWLREALALQRIQDAWYADEVFGGYYRTASDGESPIAREKPKRDGAVPSGNSVAALNLLRLATFTSDDEWQEKASLAFAGYHELLQRRPEAVAELLVALDFAIDPKKEILLVHRPGVDPELLLSRLRPAFVPNRILSVVAEGDDLARHAVEVPLLAHKRARKAGVTAYVCENRVCRLPTSDPEIFERLIGSGAPSPGGARRGEPR